MKIFYLLIFLLQLTSFSNAQSTLEKDRIAFYNVENLFDTLNDPLTRDDEFTPYGSKKWNSDKFRYKINHIYKTLIAIGEWDLVSMAGFAEVENCYVLKALIKQTPLNKYNYEYISEESKDERGIDVGFIFRKDIFKYQCHELINVPIENPTRDILYVKGLMHGDIYHVYINHWPSRIGGKEHTSTLRKKAAMALLQHIRTVQNEFENPKIIIMGDFNDERDDQSLTKILQPSSQDELGEPVNIIAFFDDKSDGTVTHTDVIKKWYWFDMILLSSNIASERLKIFRPDWLIDKNGNPKRTYLGDFYNGGISDHLPVYIDLIRD